MFKKTFIILLAVFLVFAFFGCGSDSTTGPDISSIPDNTAGNDYLNTYNTVNTGATDSDFDDNYNSAYTDIFANWLYFPTIFFDIFQDMKNNAVYNSTEQRWETEIDNPFGNDPATVTLYGEYEGDVFRIHSPDDPAGSGLFIYPDGGVSLYMEFDLTYIKMEIYKENGYYYGFMRFNEEGPQILKFKYEDQTPCNDFKLKFGEYNGSSTVGDYQLIRDRSETAENWYIDESDMTKWFSCSWDGSAFTYQFYMSV